MTQNDAQELDAKSRGQSRRIDDMGSSMQRPRPRGHSLRAVLAGKPVPSMAL